MIEKKIHYVWFGQNPLPPLVKKCIASWKKYCPDYEIIEWNEKTFDIHINQYVLEAYQSKKWAFVSDYVRLYALYHFGGLYMDTDVQVLKSLDGFLDNPAFFGYESETYISTAIIGAKKGHPMIKELLDEYEGRKFILDDGSFDFTTNVEQISRYFKQMGIQLDNSYKVYDSCTFYPSDYFSPKNNLTKAIHLTENSATIHHFDGTWIPKSKKIKYAILRRLSPKITDGLVNMKAKIKRLL